MSEWKTTSCVLCSQNCGLEVETDNNRIVKVRGDKKNPRSKGYLCVKGANVAYHQHHSDRLSHPLKKTPTGFEQISWEQAIQEIAEKLKKIVSEHGPRSFAYMGGGGQGCHFEAAFGTTLMKSLGSRYHYSALAQEFSGVFWVFGKMLGSQNRFAIEDETNSDMLIAMGWNGMESHQMPRAPLVLREFAKNPDKLLVVIDPRKSETAKIANIHLPLRPGTDALLMKAMISIILREGWEKRDYIEKYCTGFEKIGSWFKDFDVKAALEVCELGYDEVYSLCRELSKRRWCVHQDLGVYMNRHSTAASYLIMILAAICGRICAPGGNVIKGGLVPLGSNTDDKDPKTWRTVTTNIPSVIGTFPPNVLPEEILSEHPERPRALLICGSNPLRSYADTTAYEKAFAKLELVVTIEIAMTETAALSHYVLPARSGFESWDGTFFPLTFPEIYFSMRQPVVKPEGERLECGQIETRIAKASGLVPKIPDYLYNAAKNEDLFGFTMALFSFMQKNPKSMKSMPFVLAETIGACYDSAHLSTLWGILMAMTKSGRKNAERAGFQTGKWLDALKQPERIVRAIKAAFKYQSYAPFMALSPEIRQSETIFNALLKHPEGMWIGKLNTENNMKELRTEDGKIHLHIADVEEWVKKIDAESERKALLPNPDYPFILNAGRHSRKVANTLMRAPAWLESKQGCSAAIHPDDAQSLGIKDGDIVRVTTEAGSEETEAEVTLDVRKGQVLIPHGFGLVYQGKKFGANVNRLTKNTHRDPLGTPLHRYVPCRIEKIIF